MTASPTTKNTSSKPTQPPAKTRHERQAQGDQETVDDCTEEPGDKIEKHQSEPPEIWWKKEKMIQQATAETIEASISETPAE
jgi:hypothetical protein